MLADARNRRSHFLSATGRMSLAAFARQFSAMAHGIPVVLHLARRWGIRKPQSSSRSDRSHPDRARTSTIRGSHRQPEREDHRSRRTSWLRRRQEDHGTQTPCNGRYRWSRPYHTGPSCRSEEHTSELQSLMRISYAVFCLKKKINKHQNILETINRIIYQYDITRHIRILYKHVSVIKKTRSSNK